MSPRCSRNNGEKRAVGSGWQEEQSSALSGVGGGAGSLKVRELGLSVIRADLCAGHADQHRR